MRILVISSLYPPYFKGGYEIMCKLVNDKLMQRGHTIRVLTSDFKLNKKKIEKEVYRIFDYNFGKRTSFLKNLKLEIKNNWILKKQIRNFKPDIISIWHPIFLFRTILTHLHSLGIPIIYNLGDHWLIPWYYSKGDEGWFGYFEFGRSRIKNLIKLALKKIMSFLVPTEWKPLDLKNIWFVSKSLKKQYLEAGLPVSSGQVIYNGLELEKFPLIPQKRDENILRLLWLGRIVDYKGTHKAIEAMAILINKLGIRNVKLVIAGESDNDKYFSFLKSLVEKHNVGNNVFFIGELSRDEVIEKYLESDIFLFTSIYKEPFGLTWLEACACGVPVVAAKRGAIEEIFIDGENGITYEPENSDALALGIKKLIDDRFLYRKIQKNAIKIVKEKFNIEEMVDKIENLYQEAYRMR